MAGTFSAGFSTARGFPWPVGITSVLVGALVGVVLGLISGFFGGFLDGLIMRTSDVLFAFPGILLAIAIVALLGPGLVNVVVAVSVFSMPTFARIVRGSTLGLKESLYVRAAKSVGASKRRIIVHPHHAWHLKRSDCIFHHAYRNFHHYRLQLEFFGPGRPAAHPGVGGHAGREPRLYRSCRSHDHIPRPGDFSNRTVFQPVPAMASGPALDPKTK